MNCGYSHTLPDDPIVFPGEPGQSHLHDFFGNATTSAASTAASMRAGPTECKDHGDRAGYWSPAASLGDRRLQPIRAAAYYFGLRARRVESFPPGIEMIGGNADAATTAGNPHVSWFCGVNRSPSVPHPYDCRGYAERYRAVDGVVARVDFPTCWDGSGREPSDVAYASSGGRCPADHVHTLPELTLRVHFGVMDPCLPSVPCGPTTVSAGDIRMKLSSGPYWTFHADFWNTWVSSRLSELVRTCLNAHRACGKIGGA